MKELKARHNPPSRPFKKTDLTISFPEMLQLLFEQRVSGKITLILKHGRPTMMIRSRQVTYFSEIFP